MVLEAEKVPASVSALLLVKALYASTHAESGRTSRHVWKRIREGGREGGGVVPVARLTMTHSPANCSSPPRVRS
jgi:hypothetical protein